MDRYDQRGKYGGTDDVAPWSASFDKLNSYIVSALTFSDLNPQLIPVKSQIKVNKYICRNYTLEL